MVDASRRFFLRGQPAQAQRQPPRPPWALSPDAAFTSACTRCGDCLRVCPSQVLRSGDGGFPEIDFQHAGCSLCGDCRQACGSGALSRGAGAAADAFAWRVQAGEACLTRHGVECRLCGDACDTRALRFVPAPGGIAQLQLRTGDCTGCGECLPRCPVRALSLK